ncbi:MAG: NUDIX domain-containing protein [Roseibium sp.]|nr:NUDIX domain-containing protein [Roseibium sp.]
MHIHHKAYVYLTCRNDLLVFEEPDNPEIGLQVPGGTLDPGESFLLGARREFAEETGLHLDMAVDHLCDEDYFVAPQARATGNTNEPQRPVTGCHRRRMFHAKIRSKPAEEWEHFEMTPSFGGEPIRFRLFWLDLKSRTATADDAFYMGFGALLPALKARLAEAGQ